MTVEAEFGLERDFHPAVAAWFASRFTSGPSEPQTLGWRHIRSGADTLIAAPTGSGKTLAGFLVAIDRLYRVYEAGATIKGAVRVVYVSPLKALAVDIHHNLEVPLAEIGEIAGGMGLVVPPISVGVRTGDTPSGQRVAMTKQPPTILVTTPESLFLLVTAERSRATLTGVETVIVDEIHALARDKRGSHLALTLERLDSLVIRGSASPDCPFAEPLRSRPQRIGLSATQSPIERIGALLVGSGSDRGPPAIVDCGHRRHMELSLEVPGSELGAVSSNEQMDEVLDMIASHVASHRTTLVFVNTRRMAERMAHKLAERLGSDQVSAHHGSLSKERRSKVESRLRAGDLRALVATASLELGIDIGPVELVCQVGSPRSISIFLQRVGRSNHHRDGVPRGIIYPLSRDELVECAALLGAVRGGRLDVTDVPDAPLDILAQQIIAEVSAVEEISTDSLYDLILSSYPYGSLSRATYDEVIDLVSGGIVTGRGKRMAYVHRDQVNAMLRPRKGARLAALTSGGAIPEVGDYKVVADPDDTVIGAVNEDFAIESMAGDIFLLGTHSWRIRRVEPGTVRVVDAAGADPTVPFWTGEAPSRTAELSREVSDLRKAVAAALTQPCLDLQGAGLGQIDLSARAVPLNLDLSSSDRKSAARRIVVERCGVDEAIAGAIVDYIAAGLEQLGAVPTAHMIVFERFFDDAGGMQLVVHAPFGGRINKGYGLALRKRFCTTFDFELQAAAGDDSFVLSLGPQHSFPLDQATRMVRSAGVSATLTQAALTSPMFASRWRWNLSRALAILRFRGGRKNPLPIQRMEADDLMAAVFPALAACQENTGGGPITIPDHVLVRQTLYDCLHEAMDIDGLIAILTAVERGDIKTHTVETTEPSVFAHEILNSKPYTFLDDAPLEERRTRAVSVRRGIPLTADLLSRLDVEAIDRVVSEVRAEVRSADELHDLLMSLVVRSDTLGSQTDGTAEDERRWFDQLVQAGRACRFELWAAQRDTEEPALLSEPSHLASGVGPAVGVDDPVGCPARAEPVVGGSRKPLPILWVAAERAAWATKLFPEARVIPAIEDVDWRTDPRRPDMDADEVAAEVIRGHLDGSGPVTSDQLAAATSMSASRVAVGLTRLQVEGLAMEGEFDERIGGTQWCSRRVLTRIHTASQSKRRRDIEPVTAQDFMRFVIRWQRAEPGYRAQGRAGLLGVIEQLQGFELAAGAWEESVLPARVEAYQAQWLEDLCMSGQVTWGRFSPKHQPGPDEHRRGGITPSRATPLSFAHRDDLSWLVRAVRGDAVMTEPANGPGREVLQALKEGGALFSTELARRTGRLPSDIEDGLWELVSLGLVNADGFQAVRSLLSARQIWRTGFRRNQGRFAGRRRPTGPIRSAPEGRWVVLEAEAYVGDRETLAEQVAEQLLRRWGVIFWDLMVRETVSIPWRDLVQALRRFEARGLVRGGRFVTGFSGEQYALPEALEQLKAICREERTDRSIGISGADPLNLVGIIIPGERVPAIRTNSILLVDGLPLVANTPEIQYSGESASGLHRSLKL